MSKTTAIHWCDSTINPVMGCSGCELWNPSRKTCYAGQMHIMRRKNPGFSPDFNKPKLFPGRMAEAAKWSDLAGTMRPDKPWLNGLPRVVFVSDMGDALSEAGAIDPANEPIQGGAVPFEFLKTEIVDAALSDAGKRHIWLWLTKRPQRLAQFGDWLRMEHGLDLPNNIWVGTTVTSKKTLNRIDHLRKVGDAHTIRFLSLEPLWEEISLTGQLDGIGWVIVGGESRQGGPAEEFRCEWARSLRDECREVNVAYFLKQLGSNASIGGKLVPRNDSAGSNWEDWPTDLRVRQIPMMARKAEGSDLSGGETIGANAVSEQAALHEITVHGNPQQTIERNAVGEAVTAESYQRFITATLIANNGTMEEKRLDEVIQAKYDPYWGSTDRSPWGNVPKGKAKWKQNVAAAKAGLDRKGIAILYIYYEEVPTKSSKTGKKFRLVKHKARVYLGSNSHPIIYAVLQRSARKPKWKKQYERLEQPTPKFIVPI